MRYEADPFSTKYISSGDKPNWTLPEGVDMVQWELEIQRKFLELCSEQKQKFLEKYLRSGNQVGIQERLAKNVAMNNSKDAKWKLALLARWEEFLRTERSAEWQSAVDEHQNASDRRDDHGFSSKNIRYGKN